MIKDYVDIKLKRIKKNKYKIINYVKDYNNI